MCSYDYGCQGRNHFHGFQRCFPLVEFYGIHGALPVSSITPVDAERAVRADG